ncbi:MAG TPA: MFS transporter, partial [Methylomirabilota bacterium]|nr:MFS transporter [Methylomirabilota bacterium]
DFLGTALIFISLLTISYSLIEGPILGWNNSIVIGGLALGIVTFFAFAVTEMKVKEPLVPLHIFSSKLVTGANIATLFLYFALNGVIFFFVLNLEQLQQYPPLFAGLSLLPTILLITFLSGPAGGLSDKIGPRLPMIVGPLIVSVGMVLLTLAGNHVNYFISFFPGLVLFGIGMATVIAPLTKSALAVEHKFSGAASGVNNAVARVAALLAVALLGAIVLFLFSSQLTKNIVASSLSTFEKQQILSQKNKLGAIELPSSFSDMKKAIAKENIDDALLYSFRSAMGIGAFLAFLSAITSFLTITNPPKKS